MGDRLPKSPEAARATKRAAREFLRPALVAGMTRLTELALVKTAGAQWVLSWSRPARLRLPGLPGVGDVEEAVAAGLAVGGFRRRTGHQPLRAFLAHRAHASPHPNRSPSAPTRH
ncbi:hypothetical protein ACH4VR_14460 [Streptomyces sp. NPDC020883]|uniref:hypothetical protein n=1 Tax=Streptomyces sp. NPDC020883 TaxID=3365099 RepID=UPI00378F0059